MYLKIVSVIYIQVLRYNFHGQTPKKQVSSQMSLAPNFQKQLLIVIHKTAINNQTVRKFLLDY